MTYKAPLPLRIFHYALWSIMLLLLVWAVVIPLFLWATGPKPKREQEGPEPAAYLDQSLQLQLSNPIARA